MSLICPYCGRPIDQHDNGSCLPWRKMSRRHFFFGLFGAAAALVAKKRNPTGGLFDPMADIRAQFRYGKLKVDRNAFTLEWPAAGKLVPGDRFTMAWVNALNPPSHLTEFTAQKVMDSAAECILTVSPRVMGIWRPAARFGQKSW